MHCNNCAITHRQGVNWALPRKTKIANWDFKEVLCQAGLNSSNKPQLALTQLKANIRFCKMGVLYRETA